jgi:hypothetical protein
MDGNAACIYVYSCVLSVHAYSVSAKGRVAQCFSVKAQVFIGYQVKVK